MAIEILSQSDIDRAAPLEGRSEMYLRDGGGLHLRIRPTGRSWEFRYTLAGHHQRLGLGAYPNVSIETAREIAKKMRGQVAQGIDPRAAREEERQAIREEIARRKTFGVLAAEWIAEAAVDGKWSESHRERQQGILDNHILPVFRKKYIAEIAERAVSDAIRAPWKQGYRDTSYRVRGVVREIYAYACEKGALAHVDNFMRGNKTIGRLTGLESESYAAMFEPGDVGKMLRDFRAYRGRNPIVWSLLNLSPYLGQRPGQIRQMKWSQLDLENGLWTCPPEIMKMRTAKKKNKKTKPHVVPLPVQAVDILRHLQQYTGDSETGYCFPSFDRRSAGKPISDAALRAAIQSMGYSTKDQITPHGFRSMMQTLSIDVLDIEKIVSDRHLAHKPEGSLGDKYDKATLLRKRVSMVQEYANLIDEWADAQGPGAPHPRADLKLVRAA